MDTENHSLALSPDGRLLAIAGSATGGANRLWLRALDGATVQPLAGTEGATYPFWSPDGRSIGFFAGHKLKKIGVTDSVIQTICDASDGRGATWNQDEVIVFAPRSTGGLYRVRASGGSPVPLTNPAKNEPSHRLPQFLPDGEHLLFFSETGSAGSGTGIQVLDLKSNKSELVLRENSEARYVEPGYLLFVRDRNLMAQPFNQKGLRTAGEATPVAKGVIYNPARRTGQFAVSDNGILVFQTGSGVAIGQLTWFDLDGKKLGNVGEPARFDGIFLAPDGKRALVEVADADGRDDLWMYDLERGAGNRFASGPDSYSDPVWSPDGQSVVYQDDKGNLYGKPSDSAAESRRLFSDGAIRKPASWSPDGRLLAFGLLSGHGYDIWMMPVTTDPSYPFLNTDVNEVGGSFSPDGRWYLYFSDESGPYDTFVVPFPGPGRKRQVTYGGSLYGGWLEGGRGIVYIGPDHRLRAVEVHRTGDRLELGKTQPLFGGRPLPSLPTGSKFNFGAVFIAANEKRMLLSVPEDQSPATPLSVITNWLARGKKAAPP